MRELVMPHAIRIETESVFQARVIRQRHRRTEYGATAVFQLNGKNYVVGQEALSGGRPTRITGPDKYKKGYLEILMLAALQKLVPEGHSNIVVGCAHTTNSIPYIGNIAEALGGKHEVVRYDGECVRYTVRAMIPWDEPAGGLLRFMTRDYADYNPEDILPGQKILVIDIGGKVSSMMPAIVLPGTQVQVLWSDGSVFPIGVQDILMSLQDEMRSLYPDVFKSRSIPESILQEAIRDNGFTTVKNEPVDVSQAVLNSTATLLNEIENVYINNMDKGLDINHIIVTGGGGGLMFKALVESVLDHKYVYLADEQRTINLANLRGGEYAVSIWATENASKLKGLKEPPLYFIIDPGNSDVKAKIMGDGHA
jgi:hypothetical protein